MDDYKYIIQDEDGEFAAVESPDEAHAVLVQVPYFMGLQNCLRIVKDRAKTQIDKSKADEFLYTTVRAEKRDYKRYEAWYIVKSTPYTLNMTLEEVSFLIQQDLKNHYNFIELPILEVDDKYKDRSFFSRSFRVTASHILDTIPRGISDEYANAEKLTLRDWWETVPDTVSFEIDHISGNIGQGVYEVGYWANGII